MKKLFLLLAITASAFGQTGVRFDSNATTSASNVPVGAQAPVMTLPSAQITVCEFRPDNSPCIDAVPVYVDQALTQQIPQPLQADLIGRFGFWILPGIYSYSVQDSSGNPVGTFPLSLNSPPGPQGPAGAGCGAGIGQCIISAPTVTQTATQPVNTNFNVVTSGTGAFQHNGNPIIDSVPTGNQTVSQPSGTTLAVNSLNAVYNEELFTGATVPARVNTAIAACGSTPCYIIIPNNAPANPSPTTQWSNTYGTNISIEDQRFSNGIGGFDNGVPDFHFYHQYRIFAQGLQSWETIPGTSNSGPWALDLETIATDVGTQPSPHDGVHGNTGGLTIFSQRKGGNRGLWGENINIQYSNFNNVADGLEIDVSNNNTVDDPGDGSAGIGLNIVGGSATGKRSGVAILVGNVASQGSSTGFVTALGINAYSTFGLNLQSSATKAADISIGLPDSDPTKVAIAVSSSSIANAQFAVLDDGSVNAVNVRGQTVRSIGAPNIANAGAEIAFNQTGAQEMDLVSIHGSGPPGGFNFYSSTTGGTGSPIFTISGSGTASWGATGTPIGDSASVAQIGIVTVGQIACIKSTNPRTIGFCSAVTGASCTCN